MTSFQQGPMNMNLLHHPDVSNGYIDQINYFDNPMNQHDSILLEQPDSFSKVHYKQMINHQVKNIPSFNNNNQTSSQSFAKGGYGSTQQQRAMNNLMNEKNVYSYPNGYGGIDSNNLGRMSQSMSGGQSYISSNHHSSTLGSKITNNQQFPEAFGIYSRKTQCQNDGQLQFRNQIQISDANKIISTNLSKPATTPIVDDDSMSHIPSVNDRIASLCRNAKLESERIARSSLRFPRRAVTSLRYSNSNKNDNRINSEQVSNPKSHDINSQCQHYQGESFHCPNCLCFQENKYMRSRSSQRSDVNKQIYLGNNDSRTFVKGAISQSISLNDINCTGVQAQLSIDDLKEDLPQGWLTKGHKYPTHHHSQSKVVEESRLTKSEKKEKVEIKNNDDLFQACDLAPGDFVNLIGVEESSSKDDGSVYLSRKEMETVIKLAKRALIVGKQDTEVAASLKRGLDIHFGRAWHVVAGLGPYGSHVASVQGALAHFRLHGWAFLVWQTPDE